MKRVKLSVCSTKVNPKPFLHLATATHCKTTTHCKSLQHNATHCNVLQHTTTYCSIVKKCAKLWVSWINESLSLSLSLQHTAKLQYTATICLVMFNKCESFPIVLAATRCNKLQYAAIRRSIVIKRVKRVKPLVSSTIVSLSLFLSLQHTAAHYSTLKLHYNTLLHSDELCQALRRALSLSMFNLSESFSVVLAATHVCTVTHFTILQHTATQRWSVPSP